MHVQPLRLSRTTEPTGEPIDAEAMKDFLRVSGTDEDTLISALIVGARRQAEQFLGRSLMTQTWTMYLDFWPRVSAGGWWDGVRDGAITDLSQGARQLDIPKPPLQSITSVKTYDDADVATTFASSGYFVDATSEPGRIVLRAGQAAPTGVRVANAIEVIFVSGYGAEGDDVPEDIVEGIKRMVSHLHENRGDEPDVAMKSSGAASLWGPHRIVRL